MPFPLLSVCRCFNVVVSVAVEVAGSGPRVSSDVSSVSQEKERLAATLALAGPPSPQSVDLESPLREHQGQL